MPIDQYGRYRIVAEQIKKLMARKKQRKVTILDIGGYKGEIHRFFTKGEASITIIDLFDSEDKNYVKGSALDMPFKDNSFDYVVSFEVFEHIPQESRERFIAEAVRVTKGPIVLTAPFSGENGEVLQSEKLVNSLWKTMHGENHRWLYEHIEYKTPKASELELILDRLQLPYQKTGNNDLVLWNFMLSFNYFTTLFDMSGLNKEAQRFYNQHASILESNTEFFYRYIYVIGEDAKTLRLARQPRIPLKKKVEKSDELINLVFLEMVKYVKKALAAKQDEINTVARELEARIGMYDDLRKEFDRLQSEATQAKHHILKRAARRSVNAVKRLHS